MAAMSKARKSKPKRASSGTAVNSLPPLRGIEKVAWWSVPAVGVVAAACALTIGTLYAIQPKPDATATAKVTVAGRKMDDLPEVAQTTPVEVSIPAVVAKSPEPASKIASVAEVKTETETETETQTATQALDVNREEVPAVPSEPITQPAKPTQTAADSPAAEAPANSASDAAVPLSANTVTSLTCIDGTIQYQGAIELNFAEKQPAFESMEEGGVKFQYLSFNGSDQSAELPDLSKETGSLELVCKMPASSTSIVLDSSFQRLTLRKNREGFRWRIDAKRKTNKIKLSPAKLDYDQWHHVVITWSSSKGAVLYVDGAEQDRMDYVNEQPQFANFEKIVLGRTRGPNGRFYESQVHRYTVFDQPLNPDEIAAQFKQLKKSFSFIFK